MSNVLVNNKDVVVPGEVVANGMDNIPGDGTYRDNDNIIAARLGLVNIDGRTIKLIPVSGKYLPKRNDMIICKVTDITLNGWILDTYSAYHAMLGMKDATSDFIRKGADLTQYFAIGDYMVAKIANVTSQMLIDVSLKGPGLRKLTGGRIIRVNTNKVPRVIGKSGSMVSMIKNATGCRIIVGQNGVIWLDGVADKEYIAIDAIKMIERNAHLSGLTDRIKLFLEEKTGNKIEERSDSNVEQNPNQG